MRTTYNLTFKTLLSVLIQTYKDTTVKTKIYRRNGKVLLKMYQCCLVKAFKCNILLVSQLTYLDKYFPIGSLMSHIINLKLSV